MKRLGICLILSLGAWIFAPAVAAAETDFYVAGELGINLASGVDITSRSNDRASVCDEYINPRYDEVGNTTGYETYNCTGPRGMGTAVRNNFSSAEGALVGFAAGYRAGDHVRLELEYFYRDSDHAETSEVRAVSTGVSEDKLDREIVSATERIGSIRSHNLFANVYYDFAGPSQLTPYLGAGVGVGFTDLSYRSLWVRNSNPERIRTGEGLPNEMEVRTNLAGTFSDASATLSDALFGVQLLAGANYPLTNTTTLGLKIRYVRFEDFKDEGYAWNPLRSHPPNIRRDGSEPVTGWFQTDNLEMFGISTVFQQGF